jgi:hypothetical protein
LGGAGDSNSLSKLAANTQRIASEQIRHLIDGEKTSEKQSKVDPSALIYFSKELTVPQWHYFKTVLSTMIYDTPELDLRFEITPRYRKLISRPCEIPFRLQREPLTRGRSEQQARRVGPQGARGRSVRDF